MNTFMHLYIGKYALYQKLVSELIGKGLVVISYEPSVANTTVINRNHMNHVDDSKISQSLKHLLMNLLNGSEVYMEM